MTTHQIRRRLKVIARKTEPKLRPKDQALLEFHQALNRPQDSKAADQAEREYRP